MASQSQKAWASGVRRNIVVVGKTGAGKSSVANSIIYGAEGQGPFKVCNGPGSGTGHAELTEGYFEKDSKFYEVKCVDTVGLFDTKAELSNQSIIDEVKHFARYKMPEGVSVIFFVMKKGRYTKEEEETFDFLIKNFHKDLSAISALVFTCCDGMTTSARNELIEDWKKGEKTKKITSFVKRGIYTIGIPNFELLDEAFVPIIKQAAAKDVECLRHVVCTASDKMSLQWPSYRNKTKSSSMPKNPPTTSPTSVTPPNAKQTTPTKAVIRTKKKPIDPPTAFPMSAAPPNAEQTANGEQTAKAERKTSLSGFAFFQELEKNSSTTRILDKPPVPPKKESLKRLSSVSNANPDQSAQSTRDQPEHAEATPTNPSTPSQTSTTPPDSKQTAVTAPTNAVLSAETEPTDPPTTSQASAILPYGKPIASTKALLLAQTALYTDPPINSQTSTTPPNTEQTVPAKAVPEAETKPDPDLDLFWDRCTFL